MQVTTKQKIVLETTVGKIAIAEGTKLVVENVVRPINYVVLDMDTDSVETGTLEAVVDAALIEDLRTQGVNEEALAQLSQYQGYYFDSRKW